MIKTEDISFDIEENAKSGQDTDIMPDEFATGEAADAQAGADSAPDSDAQTEAHEGSAIADYEAIAKEDIAELRAIFPELHSVRNITELENPLRYAELRDLGLSAKEAFLASSSVRGRYDNRRHLHSSVPKNAGGERNELSSAELSSLREIFGELGDRELQRLYKKVSSQTK